MLWLHLEIGVGHAEAMVGAKLQQALPVLVDLANSKVSETGHYIKALLSILTYILTYLLTGLPSISA